MSIEYDCTDCGLCCTRCGGDLSLYEEDLARWQEEDNEAIMGRLRIKGSRAAGWYSPGEDRREDSCPFLRSEGGYRCSIYETRPLVCRHFANGGSGCIEMREEHGLDVERIF